MADGRLYEAMIKRAFREARKGEGRTSPNPMVGAVVFNRDGVIAVGHHRKAGGPHAEIEALQRAGSRARGASLAVNLEPCCHFGKTGPCTEAIIKAGIKTVVYSIDDPFPQVCGRGARTLKAAGIRVITGVRGEEATRLNEAYLTYTTTGRPFVVLKTAQSLDGRIATKSGESRWISCPEALAFGHRLRAKYDAVAVATGTVCSDDPQLTVRRVRGRNPLRIVVTTSADLPPRLRLFRENGDGKTIVATTRAVIASGAYSSVTTWAARQKQGRLDLGDLLDVAGGAGVESILFEGGGALATSLLKERLVDKLYVLVAPLITGTGIDAVADLGITRLSGAIRFAESGFANLGRDILFWGYPEK
jgi:diaminohydroxyphosphoribosylaminopyrimidine deaminase/5-amino-6-(5-phosphoribosylamino)uracil reductase